MSVGLASRSCAAVLSLVLGFGVGIPSAHADDRGGHEEHPPALRAARELSLTEALLEGAARAPAVRRAAAPRAMLERVAQVGKPALLLPPSLTAQLGPRVSGGSVLPEVIVGVAQPLSLSGQGQAQAEVARRELGLQTASLNLEKADAALFAGRAWVDLALSHRVLELRAAAMTEAERLVRLSESRVRLGEAEPLELALARSQWATFRASLMEAEGWHFSAATELAITIGADSVELEPKGGLPPPPERTPQTEREDGLVHDRLLAEESVLEAKARLARANQAPLLAVGLQYQREGTGDQILTGTLSLPLMPKLPGRFQEAQLLAEAAVRSEEARWAKVRAHLEKQRATHELEHARAVFQLLVETALPEAKAALQIVRAKYEVGSIDMTLVAWHTQTVLALEERAATALADVHRAQLSERRASGRLLQEVGQ